jgi:hypothetical protein
VIARWLAIAVMCAACGDDSTRAGDPIAPTSGSRLALYKYRYDDGTELTVSNELYDTELHLRCRPQRWIDGALRCVPVVDDAVYTDAACEVPIGLRRTIARPTHFVAYDTRATGAVPARLFRAGPEVDPIAEYYTIADGACVGPTPTPDDLPGYFEIAAELDGVELVALHDSEIGDGRLAVQLRQSDDGLRVPSGLVDRELGAACAARRRGDGSFACEPVTGAAALFRDPDCHQAVVPVAAAVPAIARVVGPSGCATYHRVGSELPASPVAAPVYRRVGGACASVTTPVEGSLHAVDTAIELPTLARSHEDASARRLRRVVLEHDGLRLFDDRLFDSATDDDCRPRNLRDGVRCLPTTIASIGLFTDAGCTTALRFAEVPQRSCERLAYATQNRPFQVREIGELVTTPLFHFDDLTCQPYTSPPGTELRSLGASLDLAGYPGGQYFSER